MRSQIREDSMTVNKVIEIMSESDKSWEDAAQKAVKEASATLKGIRSIWVKDFSAHVENDQITTYRVTSKITFEVER